MINSFFIKEFLQLLGVMSIEGSSIPFPGLIFVLTFGNVIRPTFKESIIIAAFMAGAYTLASYAPYLVGRKLGVKVLSIFDKRLRIKAAIDKSKYLINKYGIIMIAVSRWFGWGNKISYIVGISKVNPLTYGLLTFFGIFPWSLLMVNLGKIFKGNIGRVLNVIRKYSIYLYIIITAFVVIYIVISVIKYKAND